MAKSANDIETTAIHGRGPGVIVSHPLYAIGQNKLQLNFRVIG